MDFHEDYGFFGKAPSDITVPSVARIRSSPWEEPLEMRSFMGRT